MRVEDYPLIQQAEAAITAAARLRYTLEQACNEVRQQVLRLAQMRLTAM